MPSKSQAQHRMMEAAAHNPSTAKKLGISPKVAQEFVAADKGRDVKGLPQHTSRHLKAGHK